MEKNLYDYDTTVQGIPQQNQLYEGRSVTAQASQQKLPRPQNQGLPQSAVGQKPKARALALARTLKRWLAVASIVGFGTFSGLVALHQVGTTASQSTQSSSGSSQKSSTSSSSSQNSNSFLNQGGNNLGSSTSSSTSVSGSSTS
jgi:hypothetical protein